MDNLLMEPVGKLQGRSHVKTVMIMTAMAPRTVRTMIAEEVLAVVKSQESLIVVTLR
jgi:hypothetical protein